MCVRFTVQPCAFRTEDYERHTNRFQVVSFVGVFIEEKMISGSVFWNAAGQVTCFCGVGVDQLDRLLLYVQPLKHNGFVSHLKNAPSSVLWFLTHQLYVVDALLCELLQGSLGAVPQGEGQALQRLVLTVHADLCLHL